MVITIAFDGWEWYNWKLVFNKTNLLTFIKNLTLYLT